MKIQSKRRLLVKSLGSQILFWERDCDYIASLVNRFKQIWNASNCAQILLDTTICKLKSEMSTFCLKEV